MKTTLATLQPETSFPGVLYLVALWRRRLAEKGKEIRRSAIEEVKRSPKQSWNWRGKLLKDFLRDNLEFWKKWSPKWLLQNLPVNSLGVHLKKIFCAIPLFFFCFWSCHFFQTLKCPKEHLMDFEICFKKKNNNGKERDFSGIPKIPKVFRILRIYQIPE